MKYVEIKGIGFPNKGAELLLCATLEQLKLRGLIACIEPYSPFEYWLNYPILTKLNINFYGINLLFPLTLLPKSILKRLGFIRSNEIELILDASGFAYGDEWNPRLAKSRILSENTKTPIILLPQSLGPFKKKESATIAKSIAKKASKIYSREYTGLKFFQEVTGLKTKYCPDITFNLKAPKPKNQYDVLIIPNFQVLKREGQKYIENLITIIKYLVVEENRDVTLLNHEGPKDMDICLEVSRKISSSSKKVIKIISPKTGLDAKGEISGAQLVITSRYHGLISALSQKIPVACYGWSFKYFDALKRFDIPTYNLSELKKEELKIISSTNYSDLFSSSSYQEELNKVSLEVEKMWLDVFE